MIEGYAGVFKMSHECHKKSNNSKKKRWLKERKSNNSKTKR
jgi:hypothetical protein